MEVAGGECLCSTCRRRPPRPRCVCVRHVKTRHTNCRSARTRDLRPFSTFYHTFLMAWLTLWGHEIFIQRRTRCHSRQLRPIKKRLNQNDCEIGGVRLKADSLRLSADAVLSTPPEHLNKYPPGQFGEQRRGRHALNIWVFL